MNGSTTGISPEDHVHCFCQQDTGGNWICCKCGIRLRDVIIRGLEDLKEGRFRRWDEIKEELDG